MTKQKKLRRSQTAPGAQVFAGIVVCLSGMAPASAGVSGGTITFSSTSAAIPAIGGAGLVLLAGLLAVLAFKYYRKAGGMTPTIVGLLGVAALASTGGGIHLVQQARAIGPILVNEPGSLTFVAGTASFENAVGSPLEVTDLTLAENCSLAVNNTGNPDCDLGTVIDDGEICTVATSCPVPSDRRLKTDISQTGVAANGLPLYRFRYLDGTQYYEGVMAQDVLAYKPSAVLPGPDGYYRVDYGQLGLRMRAVE